MRLFILSALIASKSYAGYITSSVTFESNLYHYEYVAPGKIGGKELNAITLGLNPQDLEDTYADDKFKLQIGASFVKFDDIRSQDGSFVFGFYSPFAPSDNLASIKAGKEVYIESIVSPGVNVPEPSTFVMLSIGGLSLVGRRRSSCR